MRWVALIVMVWAGVAWGEVGGYRLMSREGNVSTALPDLSAMVEMEKVLAAKPTSFEPLTGVVARTVNKLERIARQSADANATNVQRESLAMKKEGDAGEAIDALPSLGVNASLMIEDVIARPEEERGKFVVVGKINWSSTPLLTRSDRKAIADANNEATAEKRKIDDTLKKEVTRIYSSGDAADNRREELAERAKAKKEREEADNKAKARVKQIQDLAVATRPAHVAYFLTDDEAVKTWRRGQTRAVKGIIQTVASYVYDEDAVPKSVRSADRTLESHVYVGLEFVIWSVSDPMNEPQLIK